jgi:protein-S-isoprenylcysteine O-methyltransferase Ste14
MESRSPRALIDTPPVWLLACIVLAWAQSRWLPLWPAPAPWLGAAVIAAGVALFLWASVQFRRHRTSIVPRERPAALLTSGPYAFSRNPIYLADAMILTGLVLRWDAGALPLVAAFVVLISQRFIRSEEALCRAAFGAGWTAWAARTRRWL